MRRFVCPRNGEKVPCQTCPGERLVPHHVEAWAPYPPACQTHLIRLVPATR